ncbi:hypothetical protein D3C75_860070 [compost metagenome]
MDAIILQGACPVCGFANYLVKGVIRPSGDINQFIAGTQASEQRSGNRMGTGHKMGTDQTGLRPEDIRIHQIQHLPAAVIVPVAGGAGKVEVANLSFLESFNHLPLVFINQLVNFFQLCFRLDFRLVRGFHNCLSEVHLPICSPLSMSPVFTSNPASK